MFLLAGEGFLSLAGAKDWQLGNLALVVQTRSEWKAMHESRLRAPKEEGRKKNRGLRFQTIVDPFRSETFRFVSFFLFAPVAFPHLAFGWGNMMFHCK